MHSKALALRILSAVVTIVLLASCSSPTPIPTIAPTSVPQPTANLLPTFNAVQTQAVQTFVANLTQNAPTTTRIPPTNTPAPTQAATNTPVKPVSTATATQQPQPAGPIATIPVFCSIASLKPDGSTTFSPGDSFNATWVVVNAGSQKWTAADFSLTYWSGIRFTGQQKMSLPFDVDPGSDITLATGSMTAPSSAGTYRAVWAIIKGFQPYCLMPLTVVVK